MSKYLTPSSLPLAYELSLTKHSYFTQYTTPDEREYPQLTPDELVYVNPKFLKVSVPVLALYVFSRETDLFQQIHSVIETE